MPPADDPTELKPPSAPVSAASALKGVKDPEELHGEGAGGGRAPIGEETLSKFLTFYPCLRFFCAIAHRQFPKSHRPETRVSRLRAEHKKFYWLCLILDLIFVVLSAALLLAAASAALYKTIIL